MATSQSGTQPGKTGWDKASVIAQVIGALAIPIAIAGLFWQVLQFNIQQNNDHARAIDQQQQATLDTYLASMSDLLFKENLGQSKPGDAVRGVARADTLTALENLNPPRKAIVLQFLYESNLIGYYDYTNHPLHEPIINMYTADLSGAALGEVKMRGFPLEGADLSGVILSGADLSGAALNNANLSDAFLNGTNLQVAIMSHANLSHADLSGADLSGANLGCDLSTKAPCPDPHGANLDGANLSGADLRGADLKDATNFTTEQLLKAKSLTGATMPDGTIHP